MNKKQIIKNLKSLSTHTNIRSYLQKQAIGPVDSWHVDTPAGSVVYKGNIPYKQNPKYPAYPISRGACLYGLANASTKQQLDNGSRYIYII